MELCGKSQLVVFSIVLLTPVWARAALEADIALFPEYPRPTDSVEIVLSGVWGDSCIPDFMAPATVIETDVFIDVIWPYEYGTACLAVMTDWYTFTELGTLPRGQYALYARVVGAHYPGETYTHIGEFTVAENRFLLSTDSINVGEGETMAFSISLLYAPAEELSVTIMRESGDTDISIESVQTLVFDKSNFASPQNVTLRAAKDMDYVDGVATIAVTAPGFFTQRVTATEDDNDVPYILYVDAKATGEGNGKTWEDAFTSLDQALSIATSYVEVGELHLAQGTYTPAEPNGDRQLSFHLTDISLLGGFAGSCARHASIRNVGAYKTVLSGDLNGDDLPGFINNIDNSEKVVVCSGNVILDGVTVTGGNGGSGTGIYNTQNCNLVLSNCAIAYNNGNHGAGMFSHIHSRLVLLNCLFIGNAARYKGGGVYNISFVKMTVSNCTFAANTAEEGGAIASVTNNPALDLTNCIFWGNLTTAGAHQSDQISAGPMNVNYCCIQGWTGSWGGLGNQSNDPFFGDPDNGDYRLKSRRGRYDPTSQTWVRDDAMSPCIDSGDPLSQIGLEPFPNGGRVNMGAYGGTEQASKSYFGGSPCEVVVAGDVNGDCVVDIKDFYFISLNWLREENP